MALENREYFQGNPVRLDVSRSKLPLNHKFTTTFKAGHLYPCLAYSDVLPGDTYKMDLSFVCRSTTPVAPIMDDAEIQVEFYFVPHKLLLSRAYMSPSINDKNRSFEAWIGAQDSLLNMPLPEEVLLPSLIWNNVSGQQNSGTYIDQSSYFRTSVSQQLGYPWLGALNNIADKHATDTEDTFLNPFPMLAYYAVWNEFFRDPNLWSPVVFGIENDPVSPSGAYIYFIKNSLAGIPDPDKNDYELGNIALHTPAAVARYHGYFGSALPWPQRNADTVLVPIGDTAPLKTVVAPYDVGNILFGAKVEGVGTADGPLSANENLGDWSGGAGLGLNYAEVEHVNRTNLVADLRNAAGASVNVLRLAIATQRLYEAWARGGNRIQDMTAVFGVIPHDMGDDRPEFLGGKRIPLNVTQVNNTAGTTTSTASQMSIGSTGAFSNTSDNDHYFTKSFDTWGTIMGVYCVRHKDTFPNMLPKMLSRKSRLDVYWPQYANLGEMPILKQELEFNPAKTNNRSVFGYQEAYADYRYMPDRIGGCANPLSSSGIDYWTYSLGQLTDTQRTLSGFLDARDQVDEFDQTLQVGSDTAGFQFLIQFYFDMTAVRPMPLYSIPGLMDHH